MRDEKKKEVPSGTAKQTEEPIGLRNSPPHPEGFKLMLYASSDGRVRETVWNSRAGVTPFMIASRDGEVRLEHVMWGKDLHARWHVPNIGDRVFVDRNHNNALIDATAYVDRNWKESLSGEFPTREAAIACFTDQAEKDECPAIVVVDETIQEVFYQRCVEYERSQVDGRRARTPLDDLKARVEAEDAKDRAAYPNESRQQKRARRRKQEKRLRRHQKRNGRGRKS